MGGTTTNGLPYPTGTDRVMDGDNAIQALAEAVDAGQRWGDTGNLTPAAAGFTASAAFTGLGGTVRRRNGLVSVSFFFTNVNAIAAGDLTSNLNVMSVPVGWVPIVGRCSLTTTENGPVFTVFYSASTLYIGATATAISAGTALSCAGTWMV